MGLSKREFKKPLEGLVVLEFSEHLAGQIAGLRLADLGARVIKVECLNTQRRKTEFFSTYNRNKESYAFELNDHGQRSLERLLEKADVLIVSLTGNGLQEWQPEVERAFGCQPGIIYGRITGYGQDEWNATDESQITERLDDDLFIQSFAGIPWLNGDRDDPPIPFPLSVVEKLTAVNLVQGILAALVRRATCSGKGMQVEVSLLESAIDLQFELITTFLNDGRKLPERSRVSNAHVYLAAPYGIYETKAGYLALAMGSVIQLAKLLNCDTLLPYADPESWFTQRDEIKRHLSVHLKQKTASEWVSLLEKGGYWCMQVQTVNDLLDHDAFHVLNMVHPVEDSYGQMNKAFRCPIRIDGNLLVSPKGPPSLGEDTTIIEHSLCQS
ncbi:CoA transferase [Paenibacillus cisolokensis]|uniref:CaiB/BaiF CoA transferase family protein n=1 Tax=Paenibacillus cisolokensis TaxID=1658519 RepID=UPI003D2E3881